MDNSIAHLVVSNLQGQQNIWLFGIVFVGGIISSLSPCVLGLLPIIVGYIGGYSEDTEKKSVLQVTFFVLGLALVLTTLGIIAALTGRVLGFQANPVWSVIIASFILIMGLNLLEIVEIPMPAFIKQIPANKEKSVIIYPLLIGGMFALASTPCSTPILAGIMAYVSIKSNILFGGTLLFFFALGQGVILVIAALFTSLFKKVSNIRRISGYFVKFSGVLLILASVYLYLKTFQLI